MKYQLLLAGIIGLVLVSIVRWQRALAKNIAAAKQTGLPYVVTPFYHFNPWWLILHPLLLPFLRRLPKSWTEPTLT